MFSCFSKNILISLIKISIIYIYIENLSDFNNKSTIYIIYGLYKADIWAKLNVRRTIFYLWEICHQVSAIAVVDNCRIPNSTLRWQVFSQQEKLKFELKRNLGPIGWLTFPWMIIHLTGVLDLSIYPLRHMYYGKIYEDPSPPTCKLYARTVGVHLFRDSVALCLRCDWTFSLKWHIE